VTVLSGKRPKPLVLVILDGWGHRENPADNAIAAARIPTWERINRDYPNGLINASELHVGLPSGQMGNSEVGHMNIGAGRVLMQDLPRIDTAITDGSLAKNPRLGDYISKLKTSGGTCHLMGLLSPGGVHSHQDHMAALATIIAKAGIPVAVHAFLDGRDTPPKSALEYITKFEKDTKPHSNIAINTVSGRYYAMDRDKRWERVSEAYRALVSGTGGNTPSTAIEAVKRSYLTEIHDEFILPTAIGSYSGMRDGDGLLMANFRSDRAREILTALLDSAFTGFDNLPVKKFAATLGMVEYSEILGPFMPALFPPQQLTGIFGEIISNAGLKQLRIAETEKYAHVTFFFNGGREEEFPGEERILIPSPKVATYDLKPEMSAFEITDTLLAEIEAERFDVIVVNYANTDMVGHTGNIAAAIKAVETVDTCLGKLVEAVLAKDGALLITADHGNAEMMHDHDTHQAHTAHTLNLVPAIVIANRLKGKTIPIPEGRLGDVAPTLLHLLGLPKPAEMTGESLLARWDER